MSIILLISKRNLRIFSGSQKEGSWFFVIEISVSSFVP